MPYGDLNAIKSQLHIDSTDLTQDAEIKNQINAADDFINTQLAFLGVAPIPMNPVDEKIVRLSNKMTGVYWQFWNGQGKGLTADGIKKFEDDIRNYLKTQYGSQNDDLVTNSISISQGTVLGTETGDGSL